MDTKTDQNDPEAQEAALLLAVRDFMRLESAGGILLLGAALLAILMANSPLHQSMAACWIRQLLFR